MLGEVPGMCVRGTASSLRPGLPMPGPGRHRFLAKGLQILRVVPSVPVEHNEDLHASSDFSASDFSFFLFFFLLRLLIMMSIMCSVMGKALFSQAQKTSGGSWV